jgi:hypothetical protein
MLLVCHRYIFSFIIIETLDLLRFLYFCIQPLELHSKRVSDGSDVMVSFRLVGEIHKEDATYTTVQLF